jgi:hypothetical protein
MPEENKEQREEKSSELETTLRIEIDNDKRLTELQKSLEEKSAKIAVMEYEKTHNSFGAPNAPKGGDTAPLNPTDDFRPSRDNGSLIDKQFNSKVEAYAFLAKRASEGNIEAKAIEKELLRKAGHGWEIEYRGDLKALSQRTLPVHDGLPEEEKQRRIKRNNWLHEELSKWERIN